MTAAVPLDLVEAAHARARAEDRSVAAVIRQALRCYLADEPEGPLAHTEQMETAGV